MGRLIPGFVAASAGESTPSVNGGPGGGTGGIEFEDDWTAGSLPSGWTIPSGTVTHNGTGTFSNVANTFATLNKAITDVNVGNRDVLVEFDIASYPASTNQTYVDSRVRNTASGSGTGGTGLQANRVGLGLTSVTNFSVIAHDGDSTISRARPSTAGRMWVAVNFDNATGDQYTWVIKDGEAPVFYSRVTAARAAAANMNTLTLGIKGLAVGDMKLRRSLYRFNKTAVMNETEVIAKITSWGYTAP